MKYQSLFSWKNKKNFVNFLPTILAQRLVKVKVGHNCSTKIPVRLVKYLVFKHSFMDKVSISQKHLSGKRPCKRGHVIENIRHII